MNEKQYIYEAVDSTSDEIFYPLGLFLSLQEAEDAVMSVEDKSLLGNHVIESELTIEINRREIGRFCDGLTFIRLKFEEIFDDDIDETKWIFKERVVLRCEPNLPA